MTDIYEPTEDVPYTSIDSFAIEDNLNTSAEVEDRTAETKLIKEIKLYIDSAIQTHNSFDALNLPQNATPEQKVAVFDEMFNHKGVVAHLRQVRSIIDQKVKG